MTKTEMKMAAQDLIMEGLSKTLGYFAEGLPADDPRQSPEFRAVIQREADRIARMFGFEDAWTS